MNVYHTIAHVRGKIESLKKEGRRIALVPTMGALHEGHISLIQQAHEHADVVVVSVFCEPGAVRAK